MDDIDMASMNEDRDRAAALALARAHAYAYREEERRSATSAGASGRRCEACDGEIPPARLAAHSGARYCVPCQREIELEEELHP